jgi:hypothetical protein
VNADQDPALKMNADPGSALKMNADPAGPGSTKQYVKILN